MVKTINIAVLVTCSMLATGYNIVDYPERHWDVSRFKRDKPNKRRFNNAEKQQLLDFHNKYRRAETATDMRQMVWDNSLERIAQKWANKCIFKHRKRRDNIVKSFSYVGENLYAHTDVPTAEAIVKDWVDEEDSYNYLTGRCSKTCGHYTQVVWAESYALGCGVRYCSSIQNLNWEEYDGGYVVVCSYGPGGNIDGQKPYKQGQPACSECSTDFPSCQQGLCSRGDSVPPSSVTTVPNPGPNPPTKREFSQTEMQKILELHNMYRRKEQATDMRLMVWDNSLARLAQDWADRCVWTHREPRKNVVPGFSYVGENLYASIDPNAEAIVKDWYDEKEHYDFNSRSCKEICGHYTQVVWAQSYALGCGVRFCSSIQNLDWEKYSGGYVVVCNYGPGGNYEGQEPYTRGQPACSQCTEQFRSCQQGLCERDETVSPFPVVTTKPQANPTSNSGFSQTVMQQILDVHNEYRRKESASDMRQLEWDDSLAALAQSWADQCVWIHRSNRNNIVPGYSYVGENLYASTEDPAAEKIVKDWYDEKEHYDHNTGACAKVCGHYTQVVWAESYTVGCGVRFCSSIQNLNWKQYGGGYIVVCNYGPGGNYVGRKPYTQDGPACSKCSEEFSICQQGLCNRDKTAPTSSVTTARPALVPQPGNGFSQDDMQQILELHNMYRRKELATDMRLMVWDDSLARVAQSWADQCVWNHRENRSHIVPNFSYVGENLYAITDDPSPEKIVKDWFDEKEHYSYDTGGCTKICGHYTQVIWAESYALGCGIRFCSSIQNLNWEEYGGGYVVVCNYGPGGNVFERKPYTRGQPACSACSAEFPSCQQGLCKGDATLLPSLVTTMQPELTSRDGFSVADMEEILALHNMYRRKEQATDMRLMHEEREEHKQTWRVHQPMVPERPVDNVWDNDLARLAQNWADKCEWRHRKSRSNVVSGFSYVGENLFGLTELPTAAAIVKDWVDEEKQYNFYTGSCSGVCGHYTQVVWAQTYALGCGIRFCSSIQNLNWEEYGGGYIVVCNYGPGGNVDGMKPYTKGRPACAHCSRQFPYCIQGLCSQSETLPVLSQMSSIGAVTSSASKPCSLTGGYASLLYLIAQISFLVT